MWQSGSFLNIKDYNKNTGRVGLQRKKNVFHIQPAINHRKMGRDKTGEKTWN